MRALHIPTAGAAAELGELPTPTAGEGTVLIRVKAVGLNALDNGLASGMMPHEYPLVLGRDAAGSSRPWVTGSATWRSETRSSVTSRSCRPSRWARSRSTPPGRSPRRSPRSPRAWTTSRPRRCRSPVPPPRSPSTRSSRTRGQRLLGGPAGTGRRRPRCARRRQGQRQDRRHARRMRTRPAPAAFRAAGAGWPRPRALSSDRRGHQHAAVHAGVPAADHA